MGAARSASRPASAAWWGSSPPSAGSASSARRPSIWSVAHLGPIGATVEDVALMYAVIAGPDPQDPISLQQPEVRLEGWAKPDLNGLTLGIYTPWFGHAAPAVVAACETMLAHFEKAGATIREVTIPELDLMRLAHVISILSEMATSMANHREDLGQLGASVQTTLALTAGFPSADYVKAQRIRTRALTIFARVLGEVDAIITPATAITAPPIPANDAAGGWSDLSADTEVMRYVVPSQPYGPAHADLPSGLRSGRAAHRDAGHGPALGGNDAAADGSCR